MATKSEVIEFARPEGITYLKALRDEVRAKQDSSGWGVYDAISSALKKVGKYMPIAAAIFDMTASAEKAYLTQLERFYNDIIAEFASNPKLAVVTVRYTFRSSVRDGNTIWMADFPVEENHYYS